MAKFLNTTGVSYHLEDLIKGTKDRLILISPYLQFNDRIKEHLNNLNIQKRDIRIVYRENKLHVDENNWLESQIGVRTSICKNLHAKCYINENEAIITSMNLYEFSQQNNNEMGIYISKIQDPDLYSSAMEEAQRLLTISEEIRVTVKKVSSESSFRSDKKSSDEKTLVSKSLNNLNGFCIRTGLSIPFNIEKPMNYDSFKSWSKFGDPTYPEKFCHFTGEKSNGETSVQRPIMKKNWKRASEVCKL
ncbi:phospholipase D family protein [Arcticibacter eurypsychrophilus]|uniref:phospholipase D family protein n=1 Tax=Arcticibacter eurypsychrophilus TaxID=1434752 RepID=UPI00084D90A1|nr:phospholipase D family protein [Arcticibacter eurypsychrophilus]